MNKHLPAYSHDEKAVLVKNKTTVAFLWRHADDEVLIQIDNIRGAVGPRSGTKNRAAKTVDKEFARRLWKAYLKAQGYTRVK